MTYEDIFNLNEMVGYFASLVVILSFLIFDDVRKIRKGNMIGALVFIFYGVLIERIPIVILNSFIVMIQVYFLWIKKII